MRLLDFSFSAPQENILYDELLLQLADKQSAGEVLRFWESREIFIVLGLVSREQDDICLPEIQKNRIPVLRRTSGGGTVVQGPGCLNYTLVLDKNKHPDLADLRKSYVWISAKVIEALKVCGIEAVFRPISDIALAKTDKKISGNAQHRGKNYLLHHGTILYGFDLDLIRRYLRMPKDMPDYRQNRIHEDFVTNTSLDVRAFKQALADVLGVKSAFDTQTPSSQELLALQDLLHKRKVTVDF